jgi:GT2 family glycosyltransferase/tetratricopeptide (TPR) repeat protein
MRTPGITAILTAYRRPQLLAEQVQAVRSQSVAPAAIWLWVNEPDEAIHTALRSVAVDRVVTSSQNAHVHARFALALTAATEYVALFDDDTLPGEAWLENCLRTMVHTPGILGSAGVRLLGDGYRARRMYGWHDPSDAAVEVDLVGHAWFLRTEWLHWLFAAPSETGTNGEDIELSARAWRMAGVRTFCPPHPPADRRYWGSLRGVEHGSDAVAASRRATHLAERDRIVRAELAAGWQPLFLRQPAPAVAASSGAPTKGAIEPVPAAPVSSTEEITSDRPAEDFPLVDSVPACAGRLLVAGPDAATLAAQLRSQAPDGAAREVVELAVNVRDETGPGVWIDDLAGAIATAAGGPLDGLVLAGVLGHLRDPADVLRTATERLAPGGRLVADAANLRHRSIIGGLLRGQWSYRAQGRRQPDPVRFYTRRELEKLFFRAGLEAIEVRRAPGDGLAGGRQVDGGAPQEDGLSIDGMAFEDAEDLQAQRFIISAARQAVAADSLADGREPPLHATREQRLGELAALHAWPEAKPPVPLPTEHLGWLADSTRQVLTEAIGPGTRLVLELGAWLGLSSRFILDHAPGATLITVDHFQGSPEHQRRPEWRSMLPQLFETFQALNWDYRRRMIPLRMSTREGLRRVADCGLAPDVIFFDAEHSHAALTAELELAHKLFPEADWVGDDFDDPGVGRAVRDFAELCGRTLETVGEGWRSWRLRAARPGAGLPVRWDQGLTSIVLVTFNQVDYTRQCLESIRFVTDEPYELIVVDNGSTDGTAEYLRAAPDVRLIENADNRGFPAAANQGIRASRGRQVLLLNNDTLATTGWLCRLLAALESDPKIGLVGPVSNCVSGEQQIPIAYDDLSGLDGFAWEHGQRHHGQYQETDRLVGFCLLIRREVIDRIGLLDEQFGIGNFEDDDYCRRAAAAGYRAVVARDAFVHHFGGASFKASGVDFAGLLERNRQLFDEKWQAREAPAAPDTAGQVAAAAPAPRPRYALRLSDDGGLLLVRSPVKLSLCMIVRDNEPTIRACLESIRPWVDEMVIVDTGSRDRTPEICRELGARVFHAPWPDSFSAARNESLRHARGEWIFWMDSDDTISTACGRGLKSLADGPHDERVLGYVMQVHCPGAGCEGHLDTTVVDHVKLFRNRADLRFEFRIHEQIIPAIRRAGGEVAWTDLYVVHSGADHTPEGRQRKLVRDLRLLELDLAERPEHPFVLFNLGMTYADAGQHDEAVAHLRRSLAAADPGESQVRKAYALLVGSLTHLQRHDEALDVCRQARSQFADDRELLFREGLLAHELGRLEEAERAYQAVLSTREARHFMSLHQGIAGFKTHHNLALVYTDQGVLDRAEEQWRSALAEAPDYADGWRGLGDCLFRQEKRDELRQVIAQLCADPRLRAVGLVLTGRLAASEGEPAAAERAYREAADTGDAQALRALSQFLFETGRPTAAEAALRALVEHEPEDPSAHHNLGTVLLLSRRFDEAVVAYRRSLDLRPDAAGTQAQLRVALQRAGCTQHAA